MNKPRLLDLFCGAGGAGMGYHRAGFEVSGVDIKPMPRYPFEFHKADALQYALERGAEFDAIHASPPCQGYSTMTKRWGRQNDHPDLIDATRRLLQQIGKPYAIENVRSSGLRAVVMLCGSMFGLDVRRHRYFEMVDPPILTLSCRHDFVPVAVYGHSGGSSKRDEISFGGIDTWKSAMGIDWMIGEELAEAIPPAYTEYIGGYLMQHLQQKAEAQP